MDEKEIHKVFESILNSSSDTPCPSDKELFSFYKRQLDDTRQEEIEDHLLECSACMEQWREIRSFDTMISRAEDQKKPGSNSARVYLLAASILLAVGLSWSAGRWFAPGTSTTDQSPLTIQLTELYPAQFSLRGSDNNQIKLPTKDDSTNAVILNTMKKIQAPMQVRLLQAQTTVWETTITRISDPLCLALPKDLLNPGDYEIRLSDSQNVEIESFTLTVVN